MPGFNDTIFDALKLKIETMDTKDRFVSLVFDEMILVFFGLQQGIGQSRRV